MSNTELPGGWEISKLCNVVEKFIDYRGKTPNKTLSGIPLVTAKVVKSGKILEPNEFINENDYDSWMTRGLPKYNDVVLTTEAPLGEVGLIKDCNIALAQRIITIRCYSEIMNNVYLKYYLQSEQGQYELDSRASGTTVFGIKASVLKELPVILPPLPEQKAIAEVLSSLDDKIDLLHKQNKTLEDMAQTLFREWFIEKADEGWEEVKLKEVVDVGIGRTPPRKETQWFSTNPEDIKWVSIKDMADDGVFTLSSSEYLTQDAVQKFNVPIIPNHSVLLSFKMTLGRVKITTEPMLSNEAIAHFKFHDKTPFNKEYLYLFLKSYPYQTLGSTSSIVTSINSVIIKNMLIIVPDSNTIMRFTKTVEVQFNKINVNQKQIKSLEQTRDTLLPKLMSGEVRV